MATSTTWPEFLTSLYFMLGGLLVFLCLFVLLNFTAFFKRLLASRMYMGDPGAPIKPMNHAFAWVIPMLRTSEAEVIRSCGLDAAVYLRMFQFSAELFFVLTILCAPILLPLNATARAGTNEPGPPPTTTDFLTVSNVPAQSPALWAHLVLLYLASIFVLYWTSRTYRHIWALRHDYLAERAKVLHPEEYTVLVTDIPEPPRLHETSAVHLVIPRQIHMSPGKRRRTTQEGARLSRSEPVSTAVTPPLGPILSMEHLEAPHPLPPIRNRRRRRFRRAERSSVSFSDQREDDITEGNEDEQPGSPDAPDVFALKIPKSWLRNFFRVLRVVTMGFVQPPSHTDAAPATAVGESLQVDAFFHRLYPGAYLHNQGVPTYGYVIKAYHKWRHAVTKLDRTRFRYQKAKAANALRRHPRPEDSLVPRHRTGFLGLLGPKVESIPHWIHEVKECSEALLHEQHAAASRRRTGTAFVIFNSRRATSLANQTAHAVHGTSWMVHMAPQPQDVTWSNTEPRFWERTVRKQVGFAIFVLLVLFFYLPVSATSLLTSITTLKKWFPSLETVNQNSFFYRLLVAVFPPLGLRICYWIAPDLLVLLSHMQGCNSQSSAQQLAAQRFYILLLCNVFFAYLITDTIVNTIVVILKQPEYLVDLLGTAVPSTSGFFMAYIMTSTLVLSTELLCLPIKLIVYIVRMAFIGKDVCDREKLWNQGGIVYHVYFPYQNLIITLGLVYVVLAPLVLPVVLVYSLVGYFVFKHQVLYVYSYPYQTGGLLWIPFVRNVLVALIIAQVTTICLFGLKQSFLVMGLATPLPVLTFYAITLISNTLNNTFRVLPLELAVEVDEYNERMGLAGVAANIGKEYMPPAMRTFTNPDLSPDAGPADNIHELINPDFVPSQLQEAVDALSPRASMRRFSSMGFMRASVPGASADNLGNLGGGGVPGLGRVYSFDPTRARAASVPGGPGSRGGLVCLSRLPSSTDQSEEDGGVGHKGAPTLNVTREGLQGHGHQGQRSPGETDALIQELERDRVLLGEGSGMPPSRYGSALNGALQFADAQTHRGGGEEPAHRRQAEVEDGAGAGGAQEGMQLQEGVDRGAGESEEGPSMPRDSADTPSQPAIADRLQPGEGPTEESSGASRGSLGSQGSHPPQRAGLGFRFGWKLRPPAAEDKPPGPDTSALGASQADSQAGSEAPEDGVSEVGGRSSQGMEESGEMGLPLGSSRSEHLSQQRLLSKDSKEH